MGLFAVGLGNGKSLAHVYIADRGSGALYTT